MCLGGVGTLRGDCEDENSEADCGRPRLTGNPRSSNSILKTMNDCLTYFKLVGYCVIAGLQTEIVSQRQY